MTDVLEKQNNTPTPLQSQSWPIALRGQDVFGIAKSDSGASSGKTLSYLLPALIHIKAQEPVSFGESPIAIILTPTKELAEPIEEEIKKFGESMRIRSTGVYDGMSKGTQIKGIESGTEIVIGSPDRLINLIQDECININRVSLLIIDGIDKISECNVRAICSYIRRLRTKAQTLMYSSTYTRRLRNLSNDVQSNARSIMVGIGIDGLEPNKDIRQLVEVVKESDKPAKLHDFLEKVVAAHGKVVRRFDFGRSLIFVNKKETRDYLVQELGGRGWTVAPYDSGVFRDHPGCMDPIFRAMMDIEDDFRAGKYQILILTEAASGITMPNIHYVINYDFPHNIEDYVCRIDHTRGPRGTSYSMITKDGCKCVGKLIEVLEATGQERPRELYELEIESRVRKNCM